MKMKVRPCELCNAEATVFCPSDAAFLCWSCDAKVHEANFLVARHLRRAVCSNCKSFTGDFVSGVGFRPPSTACPSCTPASDDDDLGSLSSTSSSVCVSSTTSPAKEYSGERRSDSSSTVTSVKRRRSSKSRVNNTRAEAVFMNWCCKLGVETGSAVGTACRAMRVCGERWSALPFRVCLAASMWFGLRLSLEKSALSSKFLKRFEEISGVPAKIILAAESKLERALNSEQAVRGGGERALNSEQAVRGGGERRRHLEEGWAEC